MNEQTDSDDDDDDDNDDGNHDSSKSIDQQFDEQHHRCIQQMGKLTKVTFVGYRIELLLN
jgi:hypothetical protein